MPFSRPQEYDEISTFLCKNKKMEDELENITDSLSVYTNYIDLKALKEKR